MPRFALNATLKVHIVHVDLCQGVVVVFWCASSRTHLWLQRRSPGCCYTRTWNQTWTIWAARKRLPKPSSPVRTQCGCSIAIKISVFYCVFGLFYPTHPPPPPPPPSAVSLSAEEHNQTIPHQFSPTAWKVVYADRYTCQVKICQVGFV